MKKIDIKLIIEIILALFFLIGTIFITKYFQTNKIDFEKIKILLLLIFVYSVAIYFLFSKFKLIGSTINTLLSKGSKKEISEMEEIIMKYYLQKRELENAKKEAEIQAKAKEVFLQNMSHEIRTPLNGIVNMTELLKYTSLNEKQQRYVDTIIKVSNTLIDTINNILDYSKIQSQKIALNIEPFSLNEILKELKIFFISSLKEEVFILFTIAKDIPEIVLGDSFRLKQILINIIGNAIKFTPKGYIVLEIRLKKKSGDAAIIEFEINDTGIGIPEDRKSELFKSFMQVDESISRRYGGTGLGLAISKEIVEAMSGNIKVESKVKKGSSFIVEIPFKIKENSKTFDFCNENIIVFQDIPDISRLILKLFSEFSINTYLCDNIEELQELLNEFNYQKTVIVTTTLFTEKNKKISDFLKNKVVINKMTLLIKGRESIEKEDEKYYNIIEYPLEKNEMLNIIRDILGYNSDNYVNDKEELNQFNIDKKILLIEDNEVNAKAMKEMMELMGAAVTLYDNALDAIKEIKAAKYDLIISDIQLPDLSGFELIKLIRDNDVLTGKRSLVIALTAHVLGDYREKCIKAGFDDYLSKPVTMVQLYQKITEKTGKRALLEDSLEKKMGSINDNIFEKLREELVTGALKSMSKIEEALNDRNYDTIIFEAHKLKGSFGNAKEDELYRMFSELENLAKEGNEIFILEQYNRCKNHFKERFNR